MARSVRCMGMLRVKRRIVMGRMQFDSRTQRRCHAGWTADHRQVVRGPRRYGAARSRRRTTANSTSAPDIATPLRGGAILDWSDQYSADELNREGATVL